MSSNTHAFQPSEPQYKRLPYGEQQGSFRGVVACSNRSDGFFSGESNYLDNGVYCGFRYQCVEYARRFLLLTTGCLFSECGRATEIYKKTVLTDVETGKEYPFVPHDNGKTTRKPEAGDIIIYPYDDHMTPWGHVGVISYVDDERVGIAEQNQYFGSFVSPSPSYLDGERCCARFVDLIHDKEKGTWELKESLEMPSCLGWMSYETAPQREHIHKPFNTLPAFKAVRSTPMDSADHPFITQFSLSEGIEVLSGTVKTVMGTRQGSGETFVGAGTATARIVRFTLQTLFRRGHIGEPFLALPLHAKDATVTPSAAVDKVFEAVRLLGLERGNEEKLVPALAEYFGMPVEWLAAMQREFAKGEFFMCCNASYDMRVQEEDVKAAAAKEGSGDCTPTGLRVCNPHDEAWHLSKLSFHTLRLMTELPDIKEIMPQLTTAAELLVPGFRGFSNPAYRSDVGSYIKNVEEHRGPRTAFTIVSTPHMDGLQRELMIKLMACCEQVKYPVRIVAEEDLHFDKTTGKLFARPTEATPPIASPSSIAPPGDYEVNFVMAITEWHDVLKTPSAHQALYDAAMNPASDVVFAKPLWSYLCSGLINHTVDDNGNTVAATSPAVKFFDIVRRLGEWAKSQQGEETWDQEVSEFADSCRRLSIQLPVPQNPTANYIGNLAIVNFAVSAQMGHVGGKFVEDEFNTGECDGQPSAVIFLFSTKHD